MRLTNQHRDDFVKRVLAAMPYKFKDYPWVLEQIEDRAMAALPEDVKALHKKYPGMLCCESKKAVGFPGRDWKGVYLYWHFSCPRIVEVDKLDLLDLLAEFNNRQKEEVERDLLRSQLAGVARSAMTLDEMQKALPELVEFMPKQVATSRSRAVAPVGLVAKLKKAGVPVKQGVRK